MTAVETDPMTMAEEGMPPEAEEEQKDNEDTSPAALHATNYPAPPKAEMSTIPIDCIDLDENIRTSMSEQGLFELAESIKDVGQLEPVIVRKDGKRFKLIAGYRRLAAVKQAGEEMIEAKTYKNLSDEMAAQMQLTENLQREDLNHIDIARALGRARDAGMTVMQIAEKIHVGDDYVRRHLDLLRLAEPVQQLVASGRLPLKQAELIARVGDQAQQMELAGVTVDLDWDEKKKQWNPMGYSGDTDLNDHVDSMDQLRNAVASACLSLASAGWPMDEEYPDGKNKKRSCQGCPDNTATYADQPMLFAGIRPKGSDKKGFCSNESCYRCKEAAWAKVREQKAEERKEKAKEKIHKARELGFDVCEECGKVANADESYKEHEGSKLCPKCVGKRKKRSSRGGGSLDEREKRVRELKKKFPWTDEQRFALALFDYGVALHKAIYEHLQHCTAKTLPTDVTTILLWSVVVTSQRGRHSWNPPKDMPKDVHELFGKPSFSSSTASGLWHEFGPLYPEWHRPGLRYDGEVERVPLCKADVETIHILEDLAKRWKVSNIPEQPTMELVKRAGVADVIIKASKADATKLIAACEDGVALADLVKRAEAMKLPKYKLDAIGERISELACGQRAKKNATSVKSTDTKTSRKKKASSRSKIVKASKDANPQPNSPAEKSTEQVDALAVCAIQTGKKADALAAIAKANLATIAEACDEPLKGDWRRAAIAKREKELKK